MPQSIISDTSSDCSSNSSSRSSSRRSSCSSDYSTSSYSSNSSYSLSSYTSRSTSSYRSASQSQSDTSSLSSLSSTLLSQRNKTQEPISKLFAGHNFYFDKESFKSLNEKQRITSLVKEHSASTCLMLSKKTTHFIVDQPTSLLLSLLDNPQILHTITHSLIYQLNTAIKLNIKVATLDFVYASVHQQILATQHVISFKGELRVIAPEMPAITPDQPDVTLELVRTTEQNGDPDTTQDKESDNDSDADPSTDALFGPANKPESDDDSGDEDNMADAPPLEPLAYTPTVLEYQATSFSPTSFVDKDVTYNLMSYMDTFNSGSPDELSYSFEESRYYSHFMTSGEDIKGCLSLPKRPESKMGSIWSWGKGSRGQLGTGVREHWMPIFVEEDFGEAVAQVASGDMHAAAVTAGGAVWTWGNGPNGSLGLGDLKTTFSPMLVDVLLDIKVTMVACGKSHTAALTNFGTIWTWGSNASFQLGYETGTSKNPDPSEIPSIKEAVFVACGGNNTAVLNRYGHMYTMGCNKHGQRGIGKKKAGHVPTQVSFPNQVAVKYVNIGHAFMGALSMKGELYMWGRNLNNQCGENAATDLYKPHLVEDGREVLNFSCGDTHAAYVTVNGDVFTWGWGPVGQLGQPADMPTCMVPTQVDSVTDVSVVCCGPRHTVALSPARGKIWVWGANECGQAGIPDYDYIYDDEEYEDDESDDDDDLSTSASEYEWLAPQILELMSNVSMVACGKTFTIAIVNGGYVPIQFAKDGNDDALNYWLENDPKLRALDEDARRAALLEIRDDELGTDYSLLHWATYFASEDAVELLVSEKWIDPDVTDENGDTPLHICAERDIPSCVEILLKYGAKPDKKNKSGKTPIHISVENHTIDVLHEFVDKSIADKSSADEAGNTPLHYAIQLRHFDMAKCLIESAAQPQLLDKSGKTALDYCSIKEASYFKSIAQKNDVFISYAHVDWTFAEKIKGFLESYSIKCWMDTTRLEAGSDWRLDIGNGLLNSRLVLFVSSRASVVSDWCIKELHMAKKHNLTIIPVWYQRVEFDSEVRSLVFGRQFIDFSDVKHFKVRGKLLAKKLKHVLSLIKGSKPNPYLEIPILTTEELWKQLFLTIMLESHIHHGAGHSLETVLHHSAIFSTTHNLILPEESSFLPVRKANLEKTWGIVFLISNLAQSRAEIEKWWQYAEENGKKVYLCMIRGDATHVKTEDLPSRALTQTSVPIFYLESMASLHQLVFFVHLAQREQFMAKQVVVMEDKVKTTTTAIQNNEKELVELRKRFYVGD